MRRLLVAWLAFLMLRHRELAFRLGCAGLGIWGALEFSKWQRPILGQLFLFAEILLCAHLAYPQSAQDKEREP